MISRSMITRRQVGAFRVVVTETGKEPKIEERDYSWTEQANILFIDRCDDDDDDDDYYHYGDAGDDDGQPENSQQPYSHQVGKR